MGARVASSTFLLAAFLAVGLASTCNTTGLCPYFIANTVKLADALAIQFNCRSCTSGALLDTICSTCGIA